MQGGAGSVSNLTTVSVSHVCTIGQRGQSGPSESCDLIRIQGELKKKKKVLEQNLAVYLQIKGTVLGTLELACWEVRAVLLS